MSEPLYTLDEARQIIARDANAKICATTGHDLRIQTTVMDQGDGTVGRAEPLTLWCRYCYQVWNVTPRG